MDHLEYYIGQWTSYLAYGPVEAQDASMLALRAVGWECWGEGYYEEFLWKVRKPGSECWCIIVPEHKAPRP